MAKEPISTSSHEAVLLTTELLENILSHLPWARLFSSQRVCRKWQDIIGKSPTIRRKMWLDFGRSSDRGIERSATSDRIKMFDKFTLRTNSKEKFPALMNVCLNPLLRAYDEYHSGTVRFKLRIGPATKRLEMLFFNEIMQSSTNGTWRDMYMTDPPVEAVEVDGTWRVKGDVSHGARVSHLHITKLGGITLGSLYEAVVDARGPVHTWIRNNGRMIQDTTLREVVRLVIEQESERTGLDQKEIRGNSDCFFRFLQNSAQA